MSPSFCMSFCDHCHRLHLVHQNDAPPSGRLGAHLADERICEIHRESLCPPVNIPVPWAIQKLHHSIPRHRVGGIDRIVELSLVVRFSHVCAWNENRFELYLFCSHFI